ncbi:hypothetical protein [Leptolyngbya sp. FACHB-261]|uniref:hypothetical protein n=1 Tax=Leptolyngbya sp. FACHB-261 TaxID=2692806 RepID=UPI0016824F96|nr:hypothetical protein [Leptolyngbya sp. FACHB-261]MBD2104151.1 hypothetical protein [Leptolyngbya sp. FACHB-261]
MTDASPASAGTGLSRRQHLWIAASIWTVVGAGLLAMGSVFLLRYSYPGLADPLHLSFAVLALGIGLVKGRLVLDRTATRVIDRVEELSQPNPFKSVIQMFGTKTLLLIAAMMGLGVLLRRLGLSYEIRGLVYVAVGVALLWSCRRYWSAAAQVPSRSEQAG